MHNISKQTVFAIILFCFFALVLVMWEGDNNDQRRVYRVGEVLVQTDRSDSGDAPFLLEVKVASETPEKIIFDVQYFMSDQISGDYSISIHPDNADWAQSANTLRPGMNNERITVSFRPKVVMKKKSSSESMLIYINHYENGKYIGKVFDRTVAFQKHWQRL